MTHDLQYQKVISPPFFSIVIPVLLVGLLLTAGCGGGVTPASQDSPTPGVQSTSLKILVPADGIYKVSYDTLKSGNFNVAGVSPQNLKLTTFENSQTLEIPLDIIGGEDGRIDPGDAIQFYGKGIPRTDRRFEFSETNVYRLTAESGDHKRISLKTSPNPDPNTVDQTSFRVTAHYEQDTFYWQNMPDEDPSDGMKPDRWFWGNSLVPQDSLVVSFNAANHDYSSEPSVEVTFHLQSRTETAGHWVKVFLNAETDQNLILNEKWDGVGSRTFTVPVTRQQGLKDDLNNWTNSFKIVNAGNNVFSEFYFDWFEVRYLHTLWADDHYVLSFQGEASSGGQVPHSFLLRDFYERPDVYDITDYPNQVWRLSMDTLKFQFRDLPGRRYLAAGNSGKLIPTVIQDVASDLKGEPGGEYIIITHENFYDAVQSLAAYRRSQGMNVVVAKITDVYDEFSGGVADPLAIKDFLTYAYQNWNPKPRYVLLVGDATYDYKDHLGYGVNLYQTKDMIPYIPAYLFDYPVLGEVPSDNWFADVEEEDTDTDGLPDGLPEIAIGRIPAKFQTDVSDFIKKTVQYESAGPHGSALFVSGTGYQDTSFDLVVRFFPENPDLVRPLLNRSDYTDLQGARDALMNELNADPWLVNYIGHGAVVEWASPPQQGSEQWFRSKSALDVDLKEIPGVDKITADGNYFALIALNCLNGNFAVPDEGIADPSTGISIPASLAETFLLAKNKGAVAVWADSAYGFPSEYSVLAKQFYFYLLNQGYPIGESAQKAIREAWFNPGLDSLGTAERPISRDLVYTIVFFGDPATRLMRPSFSPPP